MSNPELYLIKLFREAIHRFKNKKTQGITDTELSRENADTNSLTKSAYDADSQSGGREFLAMDYFDALIAQKVDIWDDMSKFMDVFASPDKKLTKYDISMQSIPIYCMGEDIEKYSYPVPVIVKGKDTEEMVPLYGNPFVKSEYPYLSLIQVYISPESMARIAAVPENTNQANNARNVVKKTDKKTDRNNQGSKARNRFTRTVMDQFYEDLHMIIEDYVREHYQRDRFICRIYRSMSAGDFTVAISCNHPETPFILATLFRERGCSYENQTQSDFKCVFYKTYTLLSCYNRLIHGGDDESANLSAANAQVVFDGQTQSVDIGRSEGQKEKLNRRDPENSESKADVLDSDDEFCIKGRFVLRVTFNNKYWAKASHKNGEHKYSRLNGRYDFSVELGETAFKYLSKVLCDYKFGQGDCYKQYDFADCGKDKEACESLLDLIEKGYIAYINERYTFTCSNLNIFSKKSRKTKIRLREETRGKKFLSHLNQTDIEKVEKRLDNIFVKAMSLDTNRRNLLYHLGLLKRMLNLCRSINGLSDTRIYCSILIQQIDVVLDGVEDFYNKLRNEDNRYLVSVMEHAVVEAVDALNTYSKLIRDNNLQTLQTPNYSLESSVSVEKILVGYGELLNSFFEWYEKTKVCEEIYGLRQHYIPFMIPGEQEESLRTKVLFKEVKADISNNKLMVVWNSAFSDLTNFGETVGILFHEVAHNLRYRGRAERNSIILRYCTFLICDQISRSVIDNLEQSIPDLMDSIGLTRLICDSFYEAYERVVYSERDAQLYVTDFSYNGIIDFIKNEYTKFTEAVRQINNIDKFRRRSSILRPMQKDILRDNALEKVKRLRDVLVTGAYSSLSYQLKRDKIIREEILKYREEAIEALELYIRASGKDADISAKAIYDSLLANDEIGDAFKQMLNYYGLADRFFIVLAERVNANIKRLENVGSNVNAAEKDDAKLALEVRKIRDFLTSGTNNKNVEPDILAAFVSPHIVRTRMEAAEILKQFTVIYSEVASDLFMYNLAEMTPFGYFSFLSDLVPSDARIPHTYIRRFCTVMYAAFSSQAKNLKNTKDKKRYWWGFVERLYNDYVKAADRALDYLCEKFEKAFEDSSNNVKLEKYILSVKKDKVGIISESFSYWCRYVQTHIGYYRDQYFEKMTEHISFFDKNYNTKQVDSKLFDDMEQLGRYRYPNGHEVDYFKNDEKNEESLTLQGILRKYEHEYFKFLRGYIRNVYEIIIRNRRSMTESEAEKEGKILHILEELQEELGRWGFMASFLNRLYFEIHQEVVTIETQEFLAEDYRVGYSNTRRLRDEFSEEEDPDGKGCWMKPYFDDLKDTLNHPERRYDKDERKKINKNMIEMISELHYKAIRERAVFMVSNSRYED